MASNLTYLQPTQEAGRAYFSNPPQGEVVMLNLLKFRKVADYSSSPELAPEEPISGIEAYNLYVKDTLPHLAAAGSKLIFQGECSSFLIGPEAEHWDMMLLVQHESAGKFLEFAQNETYLITTGHRTAALEDSRLLPIRPTGNGQPQT